MLFLDAIQRYPRLTRLKDVIERAGIEKNSYEQEQKTVSFHNFMKLKNHEKML